MLTTKSIQVFDVENIKPNSFITFRYMDYEFDYDEEDTPITYPIVKREINGLIEHVTEEYIKVWALGDIHTISVGKVADNQPEIIITGIQPKVDWD